MGHQGWSQGIVKMGLSLLNLPVFETFTFFTLFLFLAIDLRLNGRWLADLAPVGRRGSDPTAGCFAGIGGRPVEQAAGREDQDLPVLLETMR